MLNIVRQPCPFPLRPCGRSGGRIRLTQRAVRFMTPPRWACGAEIRECRHLALSVLPHLVFPVHPIPVGLGADATVPYLGLHALPLDAGALRCATLTREYRGSDGIRTIASDADSVTGVLDFRCRFASLVFGANRHWSSVFLWCAFRHCGALGRGRYGR